MEAVAILFTVLVTVCVLPLAIIMHYVTKWKATKGLSDRERTEAYADLALGFMEVSVEIMRALKDGEISRAEQYQIMETIREAMVQLPTSEEVE